jgi:DNA polymerase III delta subunit
LLVARELAQLTPQERSRIDVGALGLNPATVGKWMEQAARFDPAELEQAIELLLDVDRQIKIGETEPEPSVEIAIVKLCTRLAAA